MARHNSVNLYGQIIDVPHIHSNDEGKLTKGIIVLKILRRPYYLQSGAIVGGKLHLATPLVSTLNEELIKDMTSLQKHDMVHVNGVLTTAEVYKSSICNCKHVNKVTGNFVFVSAIDVTKQNVKVDEIEGMDLLKKHNEISNSVLLVGSLCRNPELYETEDGKTTITQYQLAVNRKYNLRSGPERTDYPWIKSYGAQAIEDSIRLQTGSLIYVDGAIQTRQIERRTICEACGDEYAWTETVTDIYPYAVEYLQNCIFPEKEAEEQEEKAEKE